MSEFESSWSMLFYGSVVGLSGKIIFDWLKGRKNGQPDWCKKCECSFDDMINKINNLADHHSLRDKDGTPLHYFPRYYGEMIMKTANHMNEIGVTLKALMEEIKKQNEVIIKLIEKK